MKNQVRVKLCSRKRSIRFYTLDGHDAVLCDNDNIVTWARWMENHRKECLVKLTKVGSVVISTVFLGLDMNLCSYGQKQLFETRVDGGEFNGEITRYPTWDAAERGHYTMVDIVEEPSAWGDPSTV